MSNNINSIHVLHCSLFSWVMSETGFDRCWFDKNQLEIWDINLYLYYPCLDGVVEVTKVSIKTSTKNKRKLKDS
jgi:hypothetical protein